MNKFVITIDGPAGSGKSTVSKLLAQRLDAVFLDTGAMYRALTLAAIDSGINLENVQAVKAIFASTKFKFTPANDKTIVLINDIDRTEDIRLESVTSKVKYISNPPMLRELLVEMQRNFAKQQNKVVTEGRDQGSVVFADSPVKFFLEADVDERANRRYKELVAKGQEADIKQIKSAIIARDNSDRNREVGPLIKADDAIEIDTTGLNIEQVVDKLYDISRNKL